MPCSAWTTRSPAARLAASVMNSSRLRRRRGARASRSPRMSCSPSSDHGVGRKALLQRQDREPDRLLRQFGEGVAVGDPAQSRRARARATPWRAGRPSPRYRRRSRRAGRLCCSSVEIVAHRIEQLDLGVGALGGEISHRPGAGIERVAQSPPPPSRRRKRGRVFQRTIDSLPRLRGRGGVGAFFRHRKRRQLHDRRGRKAPSGHSASSRNICLGGTGR